MTLARGRFRGVDSIRADRIDNQPCGGERPRDLRPLLDQLVDRRGLQLARGPEHHAPAVDHRRGPATGQPHDHYLGTSKGHSFAGSISGRRGSFHHNLLVHNAGRNWSLAGGYDRAGRYDGFLDIRNNVVYNWLNRTNDGGVKMLNLVNNYHKPGPATVMFDLLKFDGGRPEDPQYDYVSGNVVEGRVAADDPGQGVVLEPEFRKNISLTDTPVFRPYVRTQSARDAYEGVLADVGCNRPSQDAMDRRLIREVREGTTTYSGRRSRLPGIIDTQEDSHGWPDYPSGRRPDGYDTDHDGMPDDWEKQHGFDPAGPLDGPDDRDGDGYTNLEDFLNWLAGDLVER